MALPVAGHFCLPSAAQAHAGASRPVARSTTHAMQASVAARSPLTSSRSLAGRPLAVSRSPARGGGTYARSTDAKAVAMDEKVFEKKRFRNANFPTDDEGRTYHLGTKPGEVSNRILSVGDQSRAQRLAELLDPLPRTGELFIRTSSRGFTTFTGMYQGVPVSIVTTLMGMPNMDFVVRECRAVVEGQMAFVRLGTCGGLQPPAGLGKVVVAAEGSVLVRRDPDAWDPECPDRDPYQLSRRVPANSHLSEELARNVERLGGEGLVCSGLNASADSFYSSQGRSFADVDHPGSVSGMFNDRNEHLVEKLVAEGVHSLEMETFHLLDLARVSGGNVVAAAAAIVLAERSTNEFLGPDDMKRLELVGGEAALRTLATCPVANRDREEIVSHVWDP